MAAHAAIHDFLAAGHNVPRVSTKKRLNHPPEFL
jgi:hypothetical protein